MGVCQSMDERMEGQEVMTEKNTNGQKQRKSKERNHYKEGVMTAVVISSVFSTPEVQVSIHYLVLCVCVFFIWRPGTVEN